MFMVVGLSYVVVKKVCIGLYIVYKDWVDMSDQGFFFVVEYYGFIGEGFEYFKSLLWWCGIIMCMFYYFIEFYLV